MNTNRFFDRGKLTVIMDGQFGSSGKGKIGSFVAENANNWQFACNAYGPQAGHCQTADTMILTQNGFKYIGDIVGSTISEKSIGLLNMNGEIENTNLLYTENDKNVNKIILENGISYKCTDAHKYYVWNSKTVDFEWVESKNLDKDIHQFIFPKNYGYMGKDIEVPIFINKNSWVWNTKSISSNNIAFSAWSEIFGLLVGDGNYSRKGSIRLYFYYKQIDLMNYVVGVLNCVGIKCKISVHKSSNSCMVLEAYSSELLQFMNMCGFDGETLENKKTPDSILSSSRESMAAYARGFFESDGTITNRIKAYNINRSVIYELQQILYVLGIHSKISEYRDRRKNRKIGYNLEISSKEDIIKYGSTIGFRSEYKLNRLNALIKSKKMSFGDVIYVPDANYKKMLYKSNGIYGVRNTNKASSTLLMSKTISESLKYLVNNYRVVSIKSIEKNFGVKKVYDVSMPKTHSYIANGTISHNTIVLDDGRKYFYQQLNSMAYNVDKYEKLYLGSSAIIELPALLKEIEDNKVPDKKLGISPLASILRLEDKLFEEGKIGFDGTGNLGDGIGTAKFGSTAHGVGSALARKVLRRKSVLLAKDVPELQKYVCNVEGEILDRLNRGQSGILEIAQGFALSLNLFFPFSTSRNVTVSQALSDMFLPPSVAGQVIINLRTFPIRINSNKYISKENGRHLTWSEIVAGVPYAVIEGNSGPWYHDQKELSWEDITKMSGAPFNLMEMTSVTKLPRRIATFSKQNMVDAIAFNKTHFLTHLSLNFVNYVDYNMYGKREKKDITEKLENWMIDNIGDSYLHMVKFLGTGPNTEDTIVINS